MMCTKAQKHWLRMTTTWTVFLWSSMILEGQISSLTHGPILGHVTSNSIRIWGRTSSPAHLAVRYGSSANRLDHLSSATKTDFHHDLTGMVSLRNLKPDTKYHYKLVVNDRDSNLIGSFRTLPEPRERQDPIHNPRGLFNFSFEFACGNNQNPRGGIGPTLPTYDTLLRKVKDEVLFAVLNGDWIYEENRDYSPVEWQKQVAYGNRPLPPVVQSMPNITGVWENYKTYLSRAKNLAQWHRQVPSYFTFDDHELLNDIIGTGTAGYRNRRPVFRDIGVRGWFDYLGWSNPVANPQPVQFGRANLQQGVDILVDTQADFTTLDLHESVNLHVHWGTPDAGLANLEKHLANADVEGGDPNANVYDIVEVIDRHRLRIHPKPQATRQSSYSIGRRSYGMFRVANTAFYLLDTRSQRQLHDIRRPAMKGLSMLGIEQRNWLLREMKDNTDADFHFVFSSVNFMVPHVGAGGTHFDTSTKDDAWTVFLDEREQLIKFFDQLNTPVFILTGDLHNSYAIKITETVWEFASGPHNSGNHRPQDEGMRPMTGSFQYGPRAVDIRWSTTALGDIPQSNRRFPYYSVVQINNVFNNPLERGGTRWISFEHPQVIFKFYNGYTGKLEYAEAISTPRKPKLKIAPTKDGIVTTPLYRTLGKIERLDTGLDEILPDDARMEILAEGFDWSEGPVWVGGEKDGAVLFSDVPKNTIYRWKEGQDQATVFLKPAGYTGVESRGGGLGAPGLGIDRDGRLIILQNGDRRISFLGTPLKRPQPSFVTLVDRYKGQRLNSPNDLTFHRNGDIYFTDPPFGLKNRNGGADIESELGYAGVFRLQPNGNLSLLTRSIAWPNGIAFSPDYKTLYVSQSDAKAAVLYALDVKEDGTLGQSRVFFDAQKFIPERPGVPDGLKVDQEGNLYATGPGGLYIIDSSGKHLGTLLTNRMTGNCSFGNDGRTLYITADEYLLRIRLKNQGIGFGSKSVD